MENREQREGKRKRDDRAWVLTSDVKLEPAYTPLKMVKPANEHNKNKYYRFHQDYGHNTEECRQLKDEIETLIQRGRLNKFVKRVGGSNKQESREQKVEGKVKLSIRGEESLGIRTRHLENQPLREIATIFGGPRLRGESSNSRKNHVWTVCLIEAASKIRKAEHQITFSDENLADIQSPHDDALVVKMIVANCSVARILVDNGSSVNILYFDAFLKMQLTLEMLKRIDSPLYGFNGAPMQVEGSIELLVTVGTEPQLSTVMKNFLVVNVNSTYNEILGRPGLNALQAIVSTPHLVMKFPMENGVGECRGSQKASRKCYETCLRVKGKEP
ncbi:uncharacterized protein LOC122668593 [Telopea speciosissima]|uniref:uncharacterized protein LOC122668593 n=1 Tax=Telopea speciosissima TaxID=54955 RepID=UPI001CC7ABD3|nr:uncharacterized protein LOC122668593 [Telopea speciosissima]